MCGHLYDLYCTQLCFHISEISSPKPVSIAQQKYTASKKYDPRCSSGVIASLPWLIPEVKVRWRGVQGPLHSIGS